MIFTQDDSSTETKMSKTKIFKGTRRMPWHGKPKKDATSCDKPRRGAHTRYQPRISEWGNPGGATPTYPSPERIGRRGTTRGTETSKYPEERKSTETARVAASESATAQTRASVKGPEPLPLGGCGAPCPRTRVLGRSQKADRQRNGLGRPAEQGESPVREAAPPAQRRPRVAPDT